MVRQGDFIANLFAESSVKLLLLFRLQVLTSNIDFKNCLAVRFYHLFHQ